MLHSSVGERASSKQIKDISWHYLTSLAVGLGICNACVCVCVLIDRTISPIRQSAAYPCFLFTPVCSPTLSLF